MSKFFISVNPLAAFSAASKSVKKSILKQQIIPNKFLIPWYQLAKGALKKYFADVNNYTPIDEAITLLSKKNPQNKRQISDKNVSIEALQKIASIKMPELLTKMKYQIVTCDVKEISINNVSIRVAPDVIIKGEYRGQIVLGAVKFHITKHKPFDQAQAQIVSTLLFQFLNKNVAKNGEKVLPELCVCLDVFGERLCPAPAIQTKLMARIKKLCSEIKSEWPGATSVVPQNVP